MKYIKPISAVCVVKKKRPTLDLNQIYSLDQRHGLGIDTTEEIINILIIPKN